MPVSPATVPAAVSLGEAITSPESELTPETVTVNAPEMGAAGVSSNSVPLVRYC